MYTMTTKDLQVALVTAINHAANLGDIPADWHYEVSIANLTDAFQTGWRYTVVISNCADAIITHTTPETKRSYNESTVELKTAKRSIKWLADEIERKTTVEFLIRP
jgi:hypothetical protein